MPKEDNFDEVRFSYSYQALLKTGICLIALFGNVRVRSINGHHIKLLEKLAAIMKDPDIFTIGNAMRMKRNADLYTGSGSITAKEAEEYFVFVEIVVGKASRILEEKLTP